MTELGSHLESELGSDWLFWKSFVSLCLGKLRDEEILPFFFFLTPDQLHKDLQEWTVLFSEVRYLKIIAAFFIYIYILRLP